MQERLKANADQSVLDQFGGGEEFPLLHGDFATNGNYLETDEVAVRHGVCGDPEQVGNWLRLYKTVASGSAYGHEGSTCGAFRSSGMVVLAGA